ncbi:helix-turn-helix domain-containing protein [Rhizobium leguminosarum]
MLSNTRPPKANRISNENSLLRAFQTRLEALRTESGLSRRAFADRLGIPRSSYFHLMSDAGNPSLDTVELIAERVGVHPSALFPSPAQGSPSGVEPTTSKGEGKRVGSTR